MNGFRAHSEYRLGSKKERYEAKAWGRYDPQARAYIVQIIVARMWWFLPISTRNIRLEIKTMSEKVAHKKTDAAMEEGVLNLHALRNT